MRKIAFLLLYFFLSLVVVACNSESTPTPTPKADVGPIREYACRLVNSINEFDSLVGRFEATESRADAANICRDMELCYYRLKAEDYPPELKSAREHVLSKMDNYLAGAWDWAAIEGKNGKFKKELKKNISDVKEIREGAEKLVNFIDKLYGFVRNFEANPQQDALCEEESSYHELRAIAFPSQLKEAQSYVVERTRAYLDKAWYYIAVGETKDEVRVQYKKDVFDWDEVPSPECVITPTP
jgi:hypothetical protein